MRADINMKLARMKTTLIFTTFSAHSKMTAEKRGQDQVFASIFTIPQWLVYFYFTQ